MIKKKSIYLCIILVVSLLIYLFINVNIQVNINVKESMITEYDELLANSPYLPDLCTIMYNNIKFGDINNTEKCYNVEKLINRYYPLYQQKCCLDDNLLSNCYLCKITKKYFN